MFVIKELTDANILFSSTSNLFTSVYKLVLVNVICLSANQLRTNFFANITEFRDFNPGKSVVLRLWNRFISNSSSNVLH